MTDYTLRKTRTFGVTPLFWEDERETADGRLGGSVYVASAADAEAVRFASDNDAAATLASFVADTDLGSHSVLLQAVEVRECYDLQFRGVWREDDGLQTEYCSTLRSAQTACSTDEKDTVGVALRVPFSLADASTFGTSWGSSCGPQPVGVGTDGGGTESEHGGEGS